MQILVKECTHKEKKERQTVDFIKFSFIFALRKRTEIDERIFGNIK